MLGAWQAERDPRVEWRDPRGGGPAASWGCRLCRITTVRAGMAEGPGGSLMGQLDLALEKLGCWPLCHRGRAWRLTFHCSFPPAGMHTVLP